jgi:hypothetical protein
MMTGSDKKPKVKRHSSDQQVDPKLADALRRKVQDGQMPCAVAFRIVKDLEVSPSLAGHALDVLEIRITKCQMGLFGYKPEKKITRPAESVSSELEEALRTGLVNERLPCSVAWEIAERLRLRKMEIASAAEALNLKISPCQLGAF